MVEQEAVNFEVAGSNPAAGAKQGRVFEALFCLATAPWHENQAFA